MNALEQLSVMDLGVIALLNVAEVKDASTSRAQVGCVIWIAKSNGAALDTILTEESTNMVRNIIRTLIYE